MKKIIFISCIIAMFFASSFAQNTNLQNLGLVSQLVEIKYDSEEYISNILNEKDALTKEDTIALRNYNSVRIQIDRIIYQLHVDMRSKNSPKLFKKLNNTIKSICFLMLQAQKIVM